MDGGRFLFYVHNSLNQIDFHRVSEPRLEHMQIIMMLATAYVTLTLDWLVTVLATDITLD